MIKKILLSAAIGFFWVGCASSQKTDLITGYRLISKAKVTDKVSGESHNVDIVLSVEPQKAVRMDVTALLGYEVAQLVLTPKQIQYSQREDKIFVIGPFNSKTMKPLFKQEIDPKLFWAIAHEAILKDGRYYNADVKSEALENKLNTYQTKKITIESSTFKMIWLFKAKEVLKASYYETFVLVKPDDYKLINIK